MGSLRVGHDWATSLSLFTFLHWKRKWQPTPVFLPGECQGRGRGVWWAAVYGITQSQTRLKWLSSSSSSSSLVAQSCLTLCDPMDCSPNAPLSMGFSRQEYWCGLPFPSPGDLPDPETECRSLTLQAEPLSSEPPWKPSSKRTCLKMKIPRTYCSLSRCLLAMNN